MFSERLRRPYDEGIKNVAVSLSRALSTEHTVLLLTSGGRNDADCKVYNVNVNRLLLDVRLGAIVRRFQPQAIIYVPTACGTVFSFVRAKVLRFYGHGVPTSLITLQPRPHTAWGKWLIAHLAPDWVLAQSTRTVRAMNALGCRTALLPPAVDTQRFRPASTAEKAMLRRKYGVPDAATVVAHVGHLKNKRNLACFLALQMTGCYHTVVVTSTSTKQDESLKEALRSAGGTVIDTYVASIEDIYRLADVYLFLAKEDTAAIELPLSVLEAMSCNLPVITTPFGGLPDFFAEGRGLLYWSGETAIVDTIEAVLAMPTATRTLVESYTWAAAAQTLVRLLQGHKVVD
nr:glycosyltransferase family 4 protein [Chloroflexota bacterium]